jgi:ubiquinone/menaquinone biosynthesis C-methylase UbiE
VSVSRLDYDELDEPYARHRRPHPGVLGRLLSGVPLSPRALVLEVGCGTGNYAIALAARSQARTRGLDPSRRMIAQAARRSPALHWSVGRAEALPFAAGAFDLAFSVDVIHHVADRPAFFREAWRVLGPEGRLCTVTDSEADIERRIPLSAYFPETVAVERQRYPPIAGLTREMQAAGFVAITEESVELEYLLTDAAACRERSFSSLHLISEEAFRRGLARLETDLAQGPVRARSLYTLVWGSRE